jgi:hypothetical protein
MCLFEVRKRSVFSARSVSLYETRDKRCREKPLQNLFDDFVFQSPPLG